MTEMPEHIYARAEKHGNDWCITAGFGVKYTRTDKHEETRKALEGARDALGLNLYLLKGLLDNNPSLKALFNGYMEKTEQAIAVAEGALK